MASDKTLILNVIKTHPVVDLSLADRQTRSAQYALMLRTQYRQCVNYLKLLHCVSPVLYDPLVPVCTVSYTDVTQDKLLNS
jgi:hypothetical protein